MVDFDEVMKNDPPRMVVQCVKTHDGNERFQWGLSGLMPLLTLVGYITRAQAELAFRAPPACGDGLFVVVWDDATKTMSYWVDPAVPIDPLVGMLETIKIQLVTSSAKQMAPPVITPKRSLLGPDGNPMRH